MPALDKIYLPVANALSKLGWSISNKPFNIRIEKRDLYPDMLATHQDNRRMIVEVKDFFEDQSFVQQLSDVLGQYLLYHMALSNNQVVLPIYLATSTTAFHGIWSEGLGIMVREHFMIKMIVVDVDIEEVITWLE